MKTVLMIAVLIASAVAGALLFAQEKTTEKQMAKQTGPAKSPAKKAAAKPAWVKTSQVKLEKELVAKYGEAQRERLARGLKQVAGFWRKEDGGAAEFEAFVRANFAGDQAALDTMFVRFERLLEQLFGHMHEINREFRNQADLDVGPLMPLDEVFAGYDPGAHVIDDFFKNKLAFTVLLNFPLTTLEERMAQGPAWTRRQWAEARLAQLFSKRIPAEVNLAIAEAGAKSDAYIADYNIWMHHLVDDKGERLFPAKMRLLSHWNLRDQIKADYGDPNGLPKQRMIQQVMERIVTQTIPAVAVNNPTVDWNPYTNEVKKAAVQDSDAPAPGDMKITNAAEPDRRYAVLLETYRASRKADPYSPTAPTLIARRFDEDRELAEERVRKMLVDVVSSPHAKQVAALIEKRLGRPLEPFDVWYNGFKPRGKYTEAQLDEITRKKYPTPEAFRDDIPNILERYGWPKERAEKLAANVVVDPARGSGHAMGAGMRSEKSHLRTRVEKSGMNYKGYNIAVHELGHNIEQTLTLNEMDHWLLNGVPNTAFTEALAFVFQARDLEQLGLTAPDASTEAMKTLNDFWATYEIAGVALVDMAVWHWMYDHPQATPAQLKAATLQIATDVWNQYYAPIFKKRDVVLLGIYSHMIHSFLYLPDYPMGHMIAFQIEEQVNKTGNVAQEFERMVKIGDVTPDVWMRNATGKPVGPEALLEATERALKQVQ